jgi:hypothetical protein
MYYIITNIVYVLAQRTIIHTIPKKYKYKDA